MGPYDEHQFDVSLPSGMQTSSFQSAESSGSALGGFFNSAGIGNSILGSLVNLGGNLLLQRQAQKYSERMWNAQNEYNSPKAQLERYQEAGLNPYLMYGGNSQNAGNASTPVSPSSPSVGSQDYNQGVIATSQARLASAEARHQEVENQYQVIKLFKEFNEMDSRAQMNFAAANAKDAESAMLFKQLAHYDEQFDKQMDLMQSQIDDYTSQDLYRQGLITIQNQRNAIDDWYHRAMVAVEHERNKVSRENNIRSVTAQYNSVIKELDQQKKEFDRRLALEDKHFNDKLDHDAREGRRDRTQRYVSGAIHDITHLVGNILTFGVAGIGNKNVNPASGPLSPLSPSDPTNVWSDNFDSDAYYRKVKDLQ